MENIGHLNKGNYKFFFIRCNDGEIYGRLSKNNIEIESGYYRTDDENEAFNGALSRTFIKVKGE